MSKLKPCPFCGGEAERLTIESEKDYPVDFGGTLSSVKMLCINKGIFWRKTGNCCSVE